MQSVCIIKCKQQSFIRINMRPFFYSKRKLVERPLILYWQHYIVITGNMSYWNLKLFPGESCWKTYRWFKYLSVFSLLSRAIDRLQSWSALLSFGRLLFCFFYFLTSLSLFPCVLDISTLMWLVSQQHIAFTFTHFSWLIDLSRCTF